MSTGWYSERYLYGMCIRTGGKHPFDEPQIPERVDVERILWGHAERPRLRAVQRPLLEHARFHRNYRRAVARIEAWLVLPSRCRRCLQKRLQQSIFDAQ